MFHKRISRRGILKTGAAAAVGAAAVGGGDLMSQLARAAAAPNTGAFPDRNYIFVYFSGGWDVLLSLDPRNPQVFSNANMATTRIQTGYELLNGVDTPYVDALGDGSMWVGPYMGELQAHADKLAIVRGMSMDTLTHETGRRRFLTGRPPSGLKARGSSTDTWLAASLGEDSPVPNLSIRVESYNVGDLPNYSTALKTAGLDDLLRVLEPAGPQLGDLQERQLDELLRKAVECPNAAQSDLWQRAELSRAKARQMVERRLFGYFDFRSNASDIVSLRERYAIPNTGATALASSASMAAMAATAVMNGISKVVSIRINSRSLDTHFSNWSTDQGVIQREGFDAVARMISHLESEPHPDGSGDSWLDRTTIVGFSEFSRTPLLNNNMGRDHWLGNACFLAGGGVTGGQVIGGSSNVGMNPLPADLETGEACARDADMAVPCDEELGRIEVVRPEHILQALYEEVGILEDAPDLRVKPLNALMRPKVTGTGPTEIGPAGTSETE
ncbi:MAG: hypothetical protein ACI9MR_003884 [Myxococcota bacterium]|jgi:uncharacterized protein (DUF1501 family)